MSTQEKISTRVKLLRERLGLSQEQLGARLSFTRSYISQIESDSKNPGPRFVKAIARAEEDPHRFLSESEPSQSQSQSQISYRASSSPSGARASLKKAREAAGLSLSDLGEKISRPAGYIRALEDGNARISERTADLIVRELPTLSVDVLLDGSDTAQRKSEGSVGTIGARPTMATPPDVEARYVPLISWAQCGHLTDFEDIFDYEGYVAFNVKDRKAFAVTLRGDSMEPRYKEGDVAILYPSRRAETGNLVVAKIKNEGVVFKRFQILSQRPPVFRFISENPNYEPIERSEEEMEWIYPVANVVNNVL